MSHDNPRQGRPGWQHAGGDAAPAPSTKLPWQQASTSPIRQARQPWSRLSKLIAVTSLLTVVLGGVVLILYLIRPIKPACILMAGSGYETNLLVPANVLGWKGLCDISDWAYQSTPGRFWFLFNTESRMSLRNKGESPLQLKSDADWQRFLGMIPGKIEEQTLLIYLSLHGGADSKGAYFLADDERQPTKLYVEDLFAAIESRDQLRDKNVVLGLDAPHVQTYWSLGIYQNDFVAAVKGRFAKSPAPNLYVFFACDENQVSWASEERGSSIFAHYFFEGLRGPADVAKNGRVDLQELEKHVITNVELWVNQNRNVQQTPVLLKKRDPAKVELLKVEETDTPVARNIPKTVPFAAADAIWSDYKSRKGQAVWALAPHVWRRYQEAILRLEHLQRTNAAGDVQKKLQEEIGRLHDMLNNAIAIGADPKCLGNSLPLAPALGHPLRLKDEIEKVWANRKIPTTNWTEVFKPYQNKPQESQELRTLLSKRLLDEVNDRLTLLGKSKGDLTTAGLEGEVAWLKIMETELGQQRSAELHLLVLVHRNAGKRLPASHLLLALQTRRLAETALLGDGTQPGHAYAEFIYPFIAAELASADALRRKGEDWLFGGSTEEWDKANLHLTDAQKRYWAISRHVSILRQGMTIRDAVLADLPSLAQWFAAQPDLTADDAAAVNLLANQIVALSQRLETADVAPGYFDGIQEAVDRIVVANLKLRQRFTTALQQLLDGNEVHHQRYHQIEALLSTPLPGVTDRETLIGKSRHISGSLDSKSSKVPAIALAPAETAAQRVDRQRTIATAVYKPCLEENKSPEASFAALAPRIVNDLQRSQANPDLGKAEQQLLRPVRLARYIPGGLTKDIVDKDSSPSPQQSLRNLRAYHLLMAQADRAYQDHWYREDGKSTFYVPAAKSYVETAQKLVLTNPPGVEPGKLHAQRLAASVAFDKTLVPAGLTVMPSGNVSRPLDWTTELRMDLKWAVQAAAGVPKNGVAMVWQQTSKAEGGRQGQEDWSKDVVKTIDQSELPSSGKMAVNLHAYYRGQRALGAVELQRRSPDVIVQRPQSPPQAGLAVRMDETFTYGSVSIVLDTSTSMDYKYPTKLDGNKQPLRGTPGKDRRFDYALKALYQVLESLPEGTHVSIVNFENDLANKQTIAEFVPFGKARIIDWHISRLKPLKKVLEAIDLTGGVNPATGKERGVGSPIADAIVKSMDSGFPDANEPKLTIVLTDGCDMSSVNSQGRFIGNDGVHKRLQQTLNKYADMNVFVLCFIPKEDEEYATAKQQFSVLPDQFSPRGQLEFQGEGLLLAQEIQKLLKLQLTVAPAPASRDFPLEVSPKDSLNLNWAALPPGNYQPSINNKTKSFFDKAIGALPLPEGQKLFTVLKRDRRDLLLERGIVGRQVETKSVALFGTGEKSKDWLATLFKNVVLDGSLHQTLLLENTRVENLRAVQQVSPAMVWLEVQPAATSDANRKPRLLRWSNDWNVPAPAYRLIADGWPVDDKNEDLRPLLRAWWGDYPVNDAMRKELLMAPGGTALEFTVGGKAGVIESLAVESDDKGKWLVFRVKHEPGRPVWIDMGDGSSEAEHQYFHEAGKYTAKFRIQAQPGTVRFRVMCVTSFKNSATTLHDTIVGKIRIDPPKTFAGSSS